MDDTHSALADSYNRRIDYLRISVTDRCNLRCRYCMPAEGIPPLAHAEILTYEEILRLARLAVKLGIRKIRVTGGEPLVRKGIVPFIGQLAAIKGLADLSLTTNGTLLRPFAVPLREAGLCRVNVSLDTLREDRFREITRLGQLSDCLESLAEADRAGLQPVKINTVTLRDWNLDEVADFAQLTLARPYQVRFIEFMPIGAHGFWSADRLVTGQEILAILRRRFDLEPLPAEDPSAVTGSVYRLSGGAGSVAFINPMTEHFCGRCNRLRLTPDGFLRSCLFDDRMTDVKGPLRAGASDDSLAGLIRAVVERKPAAAAGLAQAPKRCISNMSRVGG